MTVRRSDLVSVAAVAFAFVVSAGLYPSLPDPVPTHFDLQGNPNGWMPKNVAAVGIPLLALGIWAIVRFAAKYLPRRTPPPSEYVTALVAMLTAVFMAAVHVTVLYVAVTPGVNVIRPLFLLLGGLSIMLGLVMPRVRRNPIIGIRTPWTLTSEENWARTHRLAGYTMVTGGVLAILSSLLGGIAGPVIALGCFLVGTLVPAVYSFVIARREA